MNFDVTSAAQTATFLMALLTLLLAFACIIISAESGRRVLLAVGIAMALISIAAFSISSGIKNGRSKETLCQNQLTSKHS